MLVSGSVITKVIEGLPLADKSSIPVALPMRVIRNIWMIRFILAHRRRTNQAIIRNRISKMSKRRLILRFLAPRASGGYK